jgi:hypothetical protein
MHDADLEVRAPKSMSRLEAGGPEDIDCQS